MSLRIAVLASCAVLVALTGCGSGGEDTTTVSDPAIPFTFDVPNAFRKASVRPETSKGAPPLVLYKLDQLNFVDVRGSAGREVSREDIERQAAAALASLGFPGRRGKREEHSGIDMARFDVANVVSGAKVSSRLYFFAGGGGTWELECQSSGERAGELLEACDTAVDSVEFKKG